MRGSAAPRGGRLRPDVPAAAQKTCRLVLALLCPSRGRRHNPRPSSREKDARRYCAHIKGGFVSTSKLDSALDAIKNVATAGEQIIVFSFFKSALDLVEGALAEDGVASLRFDGDV